MGHYGRVQKRLSGDAPRIRHSLAARTHQELVPQLVRGFVHPHQSRDLTCCRHLYLSDTLSGLAAVYLFCFLGEQILLERRFKVFY